jgi:hypothetical protein
MPTSDKIVKIAFLDLTDTLPNNGKGPWHKYGPRRLVHYGYDIITKICAAASSETKVLWEESKFIHVLALGMKSRSPNSPTAPDKRNILWRTDERRFIRYDRLVPMIVGNNLQTSALPMKRKRFDNPFDFSEDREKGGDRDMFFRYLHFGTDGPQLNQILLGRMVTGIYDKYPEPSHPNLPQWKEHFQSLKTQRHINFGIFWDARFLFEGTVRDFVKANKAKKWDKWKSRFEINKDKWKYPSSGELHFFSYPNEVEVDMDRLLTKHNKKKAIEKAEMGFLTENFLLWLVKMREYHKKNQNLPSKQQQRLLEQKAGFT